MKIDKISLVVQVPVRVSLGKVEAELNQQGYTLGYEPIRRKALTLERALNDRIPNRYALKYGEIDDLCVAIKVRRGRETFTTRNVPRSATGPDFKKIFIGSRGRYGKILEVTLKVSPLHQERLVVPIRLRGLAQKKRFLRKLWSSGIQPTRIIETRGGFAIHLTGPSEIVRSEKEALRARS